ncbi:MAG: GIY-YIG nuclease family protein [Candidatus Omnitrophota bacterium]
MFYVYTLYDAENDKFYVGYTRDLKRRISEHKQGVVHTTVRFTKIEIVHYEGFVSEEDALRRERYFKTTKGKRTLRLMLQKTIKTFK